jgi:hypothetical protein
MRSHHKLRRRGPIIKGVLVQEVKMFKLTRPSKQHEQRGWHGLQGTLWEDVEPEEEQLVEETMVEQDVSVG